MKSILWRLILYCVAVVYFVCVMKFPVATAGRILEFWVVAVEGTSSSDVHVYHWDVYDIPTAIVSVVDVEIYSFFLSHLSLTASHAPQRYLIQHGTENLFSMCRIHDVATNKDEVGKM